MNQTFYKLLAFLLLALPAAVFAQTAPGTDPSIILNAATAANDAYLSATGMLHQIFGDIIYSPFSPASSGQQTAIGKMFLLSNACLMGCAVLFVSYTVATGIVGTANSGEFLGKQLSTSWVPIRIGVGMGALVPAFGGWNLAQLVMIWGAMIGIGIGNMSASTAVQSLASGAAGIHPAIPLVQTNSVVQGAFKIQACVAAKNAVPAGANPAGTKYGVTGSKGNITYFGNQSIQYNADCGYVIAPVQSANVPSAAGTNSTIFLASWTQSQKALFDMLTNVGTIAGAAVQNEINIQSGSGTTGSTTTTANGGASANDFAQQLIVAAGKYQSEINKAQIRAVQQFTSAGAMSPDSPSSGMAAIQQNLATQGFATLGAYFTTISAATRSVTDQTAGMVGAVGSLPDSAIFQGSVDYYTNTVNSVTHHLAQAGPAAQTNSGSQSTADGDNWFFQRLNPVTGPLMQSIITTIGGNPGQDSFLLSLKSTADYGMWLGVALNQVSGLWFGLFEGAKLECSNAATSASSIPLGGALIGAGVGLSCSAGVGVISALKPWADIAEYLGSATIMFMVFASVVLPLSFFINWVAAILELVSVWVEAVAAAPLWAFTHLDVSGQDGLASGNSNWGYLFIMNVMFRPFLMVLGFILGVIAMDTVGWFYQRLFLTAIGDAQINSFTGLIMMICYIALYLMVGVSIVATCASFTTVVPTKVLGWLGGQFDVGLGRDIVGKMEGLAGKIASGGKTLSMGAKDAKDEADGTGKFANRSRDPFGRPKNGVTLTGN